MADLPTNTNQDLSGFLDLPNVSDDAGISNTEQSEGVIVWDDQVELIDFSTIQPDSLFVNTEDSPTLLSLNCTDSSGLEEICANTFNNSLQDCFLKQSSDESKTNKNMNLPKENKPNTSTCVPSVSVDVVPDQPPETKFDILCDLLRVGLQLEVLKTNTKLIVKFWDNIGNEVLPSAFIASGQHGHVHEAIVKQNVAGLIQIPLSSDLSIKMPCIQTTEGFRLYLCPHNDCRKAFYRLNIAKLHSLKHLNHKPFKCNFQKCKWAFFTSSKLKRHLETHSKRKDFTCTYPNCNRQFTTIYNLRWHRRQSHDKLETLPCPVKGCDKRFRNSQARKAHFKNHSVMEAPYLCSSPNCNKSFFSPHSLSAHERTHAKQELRCTHCEKVFEQPCRLKEHQRQHTGQKPYTCCYDNCNWAFATASKLKRHLSTHTNERKFHCTIGSCNKSFLRPEHLRDHTLTHIGQRLFTCNECDANFNGKSKLYFHIKEHHPKMKKETDPPVIQLPEEYLENQSSDDLEQAIKSLETTSNLMLGGSLLPDEPIELLENENFSTVNLRDLD